jgi:hypothetical protein
MLREGGCSDRVFDNLKFYAHSLPDRDPAEWQPLEDHLRNVAELAAEFARPGRGVRGGRPGANR